MRRQHIVGQSGRLNGIVQTMRCRVLIVTDHANAIRDLYLVGTHGVRPFIYVTSMCSMSYVVPEKSQAYEAIAAEKSATVPSLVLPGGLYRGDRG